MTRAALLAAMLLLTLAAKPVDFCARHPTHPSCQTATPTPRPTSTASPTQAPAPDGPNVSGVRIPPVMAGYRRVAFTEFPNTQALGQGPAADTAQYLRPRQCGFRDSSGRGFYCWGATTSEHDGVLDQWLHTESGACRTADWTQRHDPAGGCNYVNAPIWNLPQQTEFVVSLVARFDDIPGRKIAYLSWCGSRIGTAGYCEDDLPEGKLDGGDCKGNGFHHHANATTQTAVKLCVDFNDWHLFQQRVVPGRFVDFLLDGRVVLHSTTGVSTLDRYWVGQAETYLAGQPLPLPHAQGHLLWDAFAVDVPN